VTEGETGEPANGFASVAMAAISICTGNCVTTDGERRGNKRKGEGRAFLQNIGKEKLDKKPAWDFNR